MINLSSAVINSLNNFLKFVQSKFEPIVEGSLLLKNIDNVILIFILSVFTSSLFLSSGKLGLVAMLVVGLTIIKLLIIKGQNISLPLCNFFLLIFIGLNIISIVNSTEFIYSLMGFIKTFIYMSFYFSIFQYFRYNKGKIFPVMAFIAVLASLEGVIGIVQNNIGLENISTWQDTSYVNPEEVVSRIYGTLLPYNPNLLGGYLVACFGSLLAAVFIALKSKNIKLSIISILGVIVTSLTVFFTGCRGAYLALFVVVCGVIVASWQVLKNNEKIINYWKMIISSFFVFAIGFILLTPSILKRIMSIFIMREDSSTSFRMNVYNSSFCMLRDNYLMGIGVGNKTFREVYGLYMISGYDALSCYCIYLEMAVESGIFALIAYLLFAFILIFYAIKKFIAEKELNNKILIFSSLISIVAVLTHGLFDTVYFRPQIQFIFWTMVSMLLVLIQNEEKLA